MIKKRIVSWLVLSAMVVSMLPTNIVLADGFLTGGSGIAPPYDPPKGAGQSATGWATYTDAQYGYKISVWCSDVVGYDENEEPVYEWDNIETTRQIGKTAYLSPQWLTVGPAAWYDTNIFLQTTRLDDKTFEKSLRTSEFDKFHYSALSPQFVANQDDSAIKAFNTSMYNTAKVLYDAVDAETQSTSQYLALKDFMARIKDMDLNENTGRPLFFFTYL